MPISFEELKEGIRSITEDGGFQSEIAQIQAKALLSEIAAEEISWEWKYIINRVIRNITYVSFNLENVAIEKPEAIPGLSYAAQKIAFVWEALSQLCEGTSKETALINAAVNYELAGYQANSMCIARAVKKTGDDERLSYTNLFSTFLQRNFVQLLTLAQNMSERPEGIKDSLAGITDQIASALIGTAFSKTMLFFLTGDKVALENAVAVFGHAENVLVSASRMWEGNIVRSIRSLLRVMAQRSIWNYLSNAVQDSSKWQRYLKLLARGVGPDIFRGRSISELWRSQIAAIDCGLLNSVSNKVIRMPTSAGKTRIAEMAMIQALVMHPQSKCVYVAPYRALVSELVQSFLTVFSDLGYRVSTITGTYESDDFEDILFYNTDVIVTTPEKLDLLMRTEPKVLDAVRLCVIDEVQMIHEYERGIKFELLLTRLRKRLTDARFLLLSAVVPQETLEDFVSWFGGVPSQDIVVSDWRPSIQRLAKFEWRGKTGTIRYAHDNDIQVLSEFVPGVIRHRAYEFTNPDTGKINRRRFPDKANKSQIAAELAFKFSELGPLLIFCPQTNLCESVARALQYRLELCRLTHENIPSYFIAENDNRSITMAEEWLGPDHFVTTSLKSGIAVHYGRLPNIVRNAIESDFRRRKYKILVATNTLAQGVNLPLSTVIIHSCYRADENGIRYPISARDYWNIAGRAGRACEETKGFIIHIKITEQDERIYRYYLEHRENVEPVEGALYRRMIDLIQSRISEEALREVLDPEILTLLVEEDTDTISTDQAAKILSESLMSFQAKRYGHPTERMQKLIVDLSQSINSSIPDSELKATYSSTGLSTSSCLSISDHISKNKDEVKEVLVGADAEQLDELIDLVVPPCLSLPEIQPKDGFEGSYTELLKSWIEGSEIKTLINEYAKRPNSQGGLTRCIEDVFEYRLPWGISGYLRIAEKLLQIEHKDYSTFMKFFPSMIKFGIPDPIACWVMAIGIPVRRVAMEIASAFQIEYTQHSYENFLVWLNTLTPERLQQDFGLRSPILDDVSQAILISGVNPVLRRYETLGKLLPLDVEVRGISYHNRHLAARKLKIGQSVDILRDYDNIVDHNAIAVWCNGKQIGFIPREEAQVLAAEMDTGQTLFAKVVNVELQERIPKIMIRIDTE